MNVKSEKAKNKRMFDRKMTSFKRDTNKLTGAKKWDINVKRSKGIKQVFDVDRGRSDNKILGINV